MLGGNCMVSLPNPIDKTEPCKMAKFSIRRVALVFAMIAIAASRVNAQTEQVPPDSLEVVNDGAAPDVLHSAIWNE